MSGTGKILDIVEDALAAAAGVMIVFAMLAVCADVILRYFFNRPLGWVMQFSEYVLLFVPFLGAAYVLKHDAHIRVDIVVGHLSPQTKNWFDLWGSILGFGVMAVLTYAGCAVVTDYYQRAVPTLGTVRVPEYLVLLAVPLGSAPLALEFLRKAFRQSAVLRKGVAS
ncbi:MAG: TRAP transporter small permease [Pseudomonadota bacterium]